MLLSGEKHLPGEISDLPTWNLPPALRIHLHGLLLRLSNVSGLFSQALCEGNPTEAVRMGGRRKVQLQQRR